MANEILIVLVHFNLAAAAATFAVLWARRPVRERFGAEVAYRLWIGVPIAAVAALFPPAQATRIVPPGVGPHFDPVWAASQGLAHAPAPALLTLWLAGAAMGVLILARRPVALPGPGPTRHGRPRGRRRRRPPGDHARRRRSPVHA
ncbi:MAG: hypothetical protein JSS35_19480 [Proteobacteria bacterium]|nr:hypothetical protein [Pseudomonadota bacterium]